MGYQTKKVSAATAVIQSFYNPTRKEVEGLVWLCESLRLHLSDELRAAEKTANITAQKKQRHPKTYTPPVPCSKLLKLKQKMLKPLDKKMSILTSYFVSYISKTLSEGKLSSSSALVCFRFRSVSEVFLTIKCRNG